MTFYGNKVALTWFAVKPESGKGGIYIRIRQWENQVVSTL